MAEATDVLERVKQAMTSKDTAALQECYDDRAKLVSPQGEYEGRAAIAKSYETWLGRFEALEAEVSNQLEAGGKAVEEWVMKASNTADIPSGAFGEAIPASNRSVTVHVANIVTVEGDRIVTHHVYYDQKEIVDQLSAGH